MDGGPHLALLSYPGVPRSDPTSARSFVYDDALALLWLTTTGAEEKARALAHTLVAIQNGDGTYTLTRTDQVRYTFSTTGQLQQMVDPRRFWSYE